MTTPVASSGVIVETQTVYVYDGHKGIVVLTDFFYCRTTSQVYHYKYEVHDCSSWPSLFEPLHEKTNNLHMRKQRRISASQ